MVAVIWARRALIDLKRCVEYIAADSLNAAGRMTTRLRIAADGLAHHPERGRIVGRYRELTTVRPFIIRYLVGADRIEILRIRHPARRGV